MHGQTVYHQATAQHYADAPVRATWQMGEAAVVRERLGIPVVSDFRPADLAAGGQGAPLVPMLDWCMYRSATEGRVLLNLGGIANISVMPAGCRLQDVVAFDTGPANMVIDELMRERFGREFDDGGKVAIRGKLLPDVLDNLLLEEWFKLGPPKSCGREQFGAAYLAGVMRLCADADGADLVRTAAKLTVRSVVDAVRRHGAGATEILIAGGGVKNAYIKGRLADELPGVQVAEGAQAKEAVAFGVLAWADLVWAGWQCGERHWGKRWTGAGEDLVVRHRGTWCAAIWLVLLFAVVGCKRKRDPGTVVIALENSPTSLDPRIGTDAASERIGGLVV